MMRFTQRDLKTLKKEAVARRKRRGQIRLTMEPAPKGMWYVHLETRRDGLRDWMFLLTVAGTGQRTWQARFNKAIKALADLEEVVRTLSRRPRSLAADIDLIARPTDHFSNGAHGGMQASMDRYMLLKNGATNRFNRALLIGHPERWAWRWHAKHDRWVKRRGWK